MNDNECSICAGTMEGDMTTLECRHTFHVGCIIQWFRFHNQSCPNCRSCESHERWSRKTPQQRVSMVRRRKNNSKMVVRLLKKLDAVREQTSRLRHERVAFRKQYAHVIKTVRRHNTKLVQLQERERSIVLEIDEGCHSVPRMILSGFVEELSSDDDGTSWERD